jgi:hypothetical protein
MTQFINTASLTSEDKALIDKIVGRALSLKISPNKMTTEMDITAVHCNCGGLRLQELLDAPKFDFIHDIAGITRHIDRDKIVLTGCFLPRFAVPKGK